MSNVDGAYRELLVWRKGISDKVISTFFSLRDKDGKFFHKGENPSEATISSLIYPRTVLFSSPTARRLHKLDLKLNDAKLTAKEQAKFLDLLKQRRSLNSYFILLASGVISDPYVVESLMRSKNAKKPLGDEEYKQHEVELACYTALGGYTSDELSDVIKKLVSRTVCEFSANLIPRLYDHDVAQLNRFKNIDVYVSNEERPFVLEVLETKSPHLCLSATKYKSPKNPEDKIVFDAKFDKWVAKTMILANSYDQWSPELAYELVSNINDPDRLVGIYNELKIANAVPFVTVFFIDSIKKHIKYLKDNVVKGKDPVKIDDLDTLLKWASLVEEKPNFFEENDINVPTVKKILAAIENRLPIHDEVRYRGIEKISLERWLAVLDKSDQFLVKAYSEGAAKATVAEYAVNRVINDLITEYEKIPQEYIGKIFDRSNMQRIAEAIGDHRNNNNYCSARIFTNPTAPIFHGDNPGADAVVGCAEFKGEAADEIARLAGMCHKDSLAVLRSQDSNVPVSTTGIKWFDGFLQRFFVGIGADEIEKTDLVVTTSFAIANSSLEAPDIAPALGGLIGSV